MKQCPDDYFKDHDSSNIYQLINITDFEVNGIVNNKRRWLWDTYMYERNRSIILLPLYFYDEFIYNII